MLGRLIVTCNFYLVKFVLFYLFNCYQGLFDYSKTVYYVTKEKQGLFVRLLSSTEWPSVNADVKFNKT